MAILMTRDVRKGLIWIAAFVLVVLAGDRAFSWLAQRVLVRSQFRYSRLYRGGNDAEIVILGDSRGVNSFYAPGMEKLTGARVLNLSEWTTFTKILLPAVLPYMLTGVRLSIGVAWLVIVAAEMLTGGVGIGFWVWDEWNNLNVEHIIIAIFVVGIVGLLLEQMLLWLAKRVTHGADL